MKRTPEIVERVRGLYSNDGKTIEEIASLLGLAYRTVQRITSEHKMTKPYRNKELLEKLFADGLSYKEISDRLGCSPATVAELKKEFGIEGGYFSEASSVLNKEFLLKRYAEEGKNISEIAREVGCGATTVKNYLRIHGIKTRDKKGRYAEKVVIRVLKQKGFDVEDMNEKDPGSIFDIKVNGNCRIEVKSTKINQQGYGQIQLINSPDLTLTDYRIKTKSGYTRKLFHKTCDLFVFVITNRDKSKEFYVVPSSEVPDDISNITFGTGNNRYLKYRDKWEQIKKPDVGASDSQKNIS